VITVKAHDKDINAVAMSPNDTILASASQDKTIKLFRFNAISQLGVQEIGVLRGHRRGVWDIAFSPVDQVLVSTSGDKTLKLWSVNDFSCIKVRTGEKTSKQRPM
jgi:U3 small nucleolar RNA-associated protein 13